MNITLYFYTFSISCMMLLLSFDSSLNNLVQ